MNEGGCSRSMILDDHKRWTGIKENHMLMRIQLYLHSSMRFRQSCVDGFSVFDVEFAQKSIANSESKTLTKNRLLCKVIFQFLNLNNRLLVEIRLNNNWVPENAVAIKGF